jgi:SAM-dependent methyltransferase
MLRKIVQSYFSHPLVRGLDIDSPEATLMHQRVIQEKAFLKDIYHAWYASILASLGENRAGRVVELGAGGGFFKDVFPGLITSEIFRTASVDMVLDGQDLPFGKAALNGIVMIDVFHHLSDSRRFFYEAACCVKPGGVIVMIEPWVTPWSRLVYGYLHPEQFEPGADYWHLPGTGRMSGANSALPWIVFDRDRHIFEQDFHEWRIQDITLHTPLTYLLSGGVSFRSILSERMLGVVRKLEDLLTPWMKHWAMFAKIVVERTDL